MQIGGQKQYFCINIIKGNLDEFQTILSGLQANIRY